MSETPPSAERIAELLAGMEYLDATMPVEEAGADPTFTVGELRAALQSHARLVEAERLLDRAVPLVGRWHDTHWNRTRPVPTTEETVLLLADYAAFLSPATATEERATSPLTPTWGPPLVGEKGFER